MQGLPPRPGTRGWALEGVRTFCSHTDPMVHYLGFLPVVDGDFIPDHPINLFANAADIDYMAGTNDMDGHIFASIDMPAINKDKQTVTE